MTDHTQTPRVVCPDSAPDADRDCWTDWEPIPDAEAASDVDIVAWLKDRMVDALNHENAHAVYGPALFGVADDGTPNFVVFRDPRNHRWFVTAKPDRQPATLTGILATPDVDPTGRTL